MGKLKMILSQQQIRAMFPWCHAYKDFIPGLQGMGYSLRQAKKKARELVEKQYGSLPVDTILDSIREKTQAGIFLEKDPQKALQEISGDVARAKKVLREGVFISGDTRC